jgi:hypothetical protein
MIVPDLYLMVLEFLEAGQGSQGIEVIVQNRDVHFERAAISGFTLCEELRSSFRAPTEVSIIKISSLAFPQYILTAAFANWLSRRDGRQAPLSTGSNRKLPRNFLSVDMYE